MNKSQMMQFRASPELADALAKAAEREGISQSEIIRRAVCGRLGCETVPAAEPDPYQMIHAAARGDVQAMRDMANLSIRWAFDPSGEFDPALTLRDGMVFARLAATHGNPADQGLFACMVSLLAEVEGGACDDEVAEMIARYSLIADSGDDMAADKIPVLAEMVTPEIMATAKEIRSRLRDVIKQEVA